MKKLWIAALIVIIGLGMCAYLKNDGIYVISNINNTELDWINKYAVYDVKFPIDTIIENFEFEDDIESYIFSHNQVINATLLVPNEAVSKIVPEFARDYDFEHSLDLTHGKTDEQIQYNVWMPRTVLKWLDKTQRSICYTVMQSNEEYTRVYVFVDKLGWRLYKYDKIKGSSLNIY